MKTIQVISWVGSLFVASSGFATVYTFVPQSTPLDNTHHLESLITAVSNSNGNSIEFPAGTYDFDLTYSGQMVALTNAHNLTIEGSPYGTTLRWDGGSDPHSFWNIDRDCRNVTIQAMEMTTVHTARSSGGDGSHIKIAGKHINVESVVFRAAPGFAINIGCDADPNDPDYIHIDANLFEDNFADGIHLTASNVYLVGNILRNCGDDSIGIVNDLYDGSTDVRTPNDVYVLYNTIEGGHWRGIWVGQGHHVEIWNNTIDGTARYGVDVAADYSAHAAASHRDIVLIRENTIVNTGTVTAHAGTTVYNTDSHGVHVNAAWNIQVYDCSIHDVNGYGLWLQDISTIGVGTFSGIYNTLLGTEYDVSIGTPYTWY